MLLNDSIYWWVVDIQIQQISSYNNDSYPGFWVTKKSLHGPLARYVRDARTVMHAGIAN